MSEVLNRFAKNAYFSTLFDLHLFGFQLSHAPPSFASLTTGNTISHISTFHTNHLILTSFDSEWSPVMNPTQCSVTVSQKLLLHRRAAWAFVAPPMGNTVLMIFAHFPLLCPLHPFDSHCLWECQWQPFQIHFTLYHYIFYSPKKLRLSMINSEVTSIENVTHTVMLSSRAPFFPLLMTHQGQELRVI